MTGNCQLTDNFTLSCRHVLFHQKLRVNITLYKGNRCTRKKPCCKSRATLAKVLGTTVANVAKWEESLSIPPPSMQERLDLLFGPDEEVFGQTSSAADATQDQGLAFLLLPHCPPALSSPHEESDAISIYDPVLPPPLTGTNRLIGRDSLLLQIKQQLLEHSSLALYGAYFAAGELCWE